MKKFHVIQNIPSPYRLHLFQKMWRHLQERGVEFHVHFMSDMSRGHDERPLSWRNPKIDFPHTYWKDYGVKCHHFNPGLIRFLRKERPDYLLVGCPFDTFTSILIAWLCPAHVRSTWSEGNTKTPGIMTGLKGWLKRAVFSKYEYVGLPGSDAAKYIDLHQTYTRKRMPKPIMLPNLIDEKRFSPRERWNQEEIRSIRFSLGVDDGDKIAITPARLEYCKGLLEYMSLLSPAMLEGWRIVIFGQGSLKENLLRLVYEKGLKDYVMIRDYVAYEDMPKYYAASDLFVLPSLYDPNPLSVVEALHSGLPVAVSEMTGNVEEAVSEGRNGWSLPVKDKNQFLEKLKTVFSTNQEILQKMGRVSLEENAQYWNTRKAILDFFKGIGIGGS